MIELVFLKKKKSNILNDVGISYLLCPGKSFSTKSSGYGLNNIPKSLPFNYVKSSFFLSNNSHSSSVVSVMNCKITQLTFIS